MFSLHFTNIKTTIFELLNNYYINNKSNSLLSTENVIYLVFIYSVKIGFQHLK